MQCISPRAVPIDTKEVTATLEEKGSCTPLVRLLMQFWSRSKWIVQLWRGSNVRGAIDRLLL